MAQFPRSVLIPSFKNVFAYLIVNSYRIIPVPSIDNNVVNRCRSHSHLEIHVYSHYRISMLQSAESAH